MSFFKDGHVVLAIDDDLDDLDILLEVLSDISTDISTLVASSASEGLRILQALNRSPTLIFLDHNMPLMSGKKCLMEIRRNKFTRAVPVVIYSTEASTADIDFYGRWDAIYMEKHSNFNRMVSDISLILKHNAGVVI